MSSSDSDSDADYEANTSDGMSRAGTPELDLQPLIDELNPDNDRHLVLVFDADQTHYSSLLLLSGDSVDSTDPHILLHQSKFPLPSHVITQSQLGREIYSLRLSLYTYSDYLRQRPFAILCPSVQVDLALRGQTSITDLDFVRSAFTFFSAVVITKDRPQILHPDYRVLNRAGAEQLS